MRKAIKSTEELCEWLLGLGLDNVEGQNVLVAFWKKHHVNAASFVEDLTAEEYSELIPVIGLRSVLKRKIRDEILSPSSTSSAIIGEASAPPLSEIVERASLEERKRTKDEEGKEGDAAVSRKKKRVLKRKSRVVASESQIRRPIPRVFEEPFAVKRCSVCLEYKVASQFNRSVVELDGLYPYCRFCRRFKVNSL